ncbi:MAG TPA: hypothetical protein VFK41_04385 [Nocardioidaceae bacterium]|nr:hypothetical protein [Nocardioidaceae bacterium]
MRGKREAEPDEVDFFAPFDDWRAKLGLLVLVVALPLMLVTSLPQALDSGAAMRTAAVCSTDDLGDDCLEEVPAEAVEHDHCRKGCLHDPWLFELERPRPDTGGRNVIGPRTVKLPFPEFGTELEAGETGRVVFWHGYTVEPRIFVLLPFLLLFVLVGRWWLLPVET